MAAARSSRPARTGRYRRAAGHRGADAARPPARRDPARAARVPGALRPGRRARARAHGRRARGDHRHAAAVRLAPAGVCWRPTARSRASVPVSSRPRSSLGKLLASGRDGARVGGLGERAQDGSRPHRRRRGARCARTPRRRTRPSRRAADLAGLRERQRERLWAGRRRAPARRSRSDGRRARRARRSRCGAHRPSSAKPASSRTRVEKTSGMCAGVPTDDTGHTMTGYAGTQMVHATDAARDALREDEALVFDWHRVAICCACAGRGVAAARLALAGRDVRHRSGALDGRRPGLRAPDGVSASGGARRDDRLPATAPGMRRFTSDLPPDFGLRAALGRV